MNENSRYSEEDIKSMSGPELLLLLYDEAVRRLTEAEQNLDGGKYEDFDGDLQRVSQIVRYLRDILDMNYAVSSDLKRIYEYLIYDISVVKAGRESRREEIGRIRHILSELREGFEGAGKQIDGKRAEEGNR